MKTQLHPIYQQKPKPKQRVHNERLSEDYSHEVLDPTRYFDTINFRPPTLAEQIARLNEAGKIYRAHHQYDEDRDEDDYGEEEENMMQEGMTPYELEDVVRRVMVETRGKAKKKPAEKPLNDPAAPPVTPSTPAPE